ncbi:MAG: phosphatase PAP2 family protein [Succinivibrio sp.]|nr:phosphatase PAP2 family protein [Succinivibrio sp.]
MKKYLLIAFGFMLAAGSLNVAFGQKLHFLTEADAPDVNVVIPPPPENGSEAAKRDEFYYYEGQKMRDTARWRVAIYDAVKGNNHHNLLTSFEHPFGLMINPEDTPQLFKLIRGALNDVETYGTSVLKKQYKRYRPFVYLKQSGKTCEPQKELAYSVTYSYPSAHSARGMLTALILAEINPQRSNLILERGYEYGRSRVICGFHWQSDVENSRLLAGVIYSALHGNNAFLKQLKKAKDEFKSLYESKK